LKQALHLRITKSEIDGAGKGLFTTEDIPKGAVIAQYTGNIVVTHDPDYANPYARQIKERPPTYIDASRTNTGEARFANDARKNGDFPGANNARFVYNARTKKSYLKAIRDILKGEEILTNYGDEYWDKDTEHSGYYLPNIKKMRESKQQRKPVRPAVDTDEDDEDWLPEESESESEPEPEEPEPAPKQQIARNLPPKKAQKTAKPRAKKTAEEKSMTKLQKWIKAAIKRLAIIQAIFNSDKVTSQIKGLVKRKTKKEIRVPDSKGMTGTDYQSVLSKLIVKEEKELATYLKRTHDQIVTMVDSIVAK
jgi:hypothetical protein